MDVSQLFGAHVRGATKSTTMQMDWIFVSELRHY